VRVGVNDLPSVSATVEKLALSTVASNRLDVPVFICIEILCKPASLKQAKLNHSEWRKFVPNEWGIFPFYNQTRDLHEQILWLTCCGRELSFAHAWRPFAERSERKGIATKGIGELPWYPGLLSLMWRSGGFLFRLEQKILVLPKLTLAGVG